MRKLHQALMEEPCGYETVGALIGAIIGTRMGSFTAIFGGVVIGYLLGCLIRMTGGDRG